uniref:Uncharacterized protein n=1 Tax=Cacopsylla melanoneura TaxID=428564 RepID=A0A8D9FIK9_9HEMI
MKLIQIWNQKHNYSDCKISSNVNMMNIKPYFASRHSGLQFQHVKCKMCRKSGHNNLCTHNIYVIRTSHTYDLCGPELCHNFSALHFQNTKITVSHLNCWLF